MKKHKVLVGTFLLLCTFFVNAQKRYELTVKEAVDLAYKNVVELKNAQLDYKIQEAKNKEIFGQALPQINGSVSASYYLQLPQVLFPQSDQNVYDVLVREGLLPVGTKAPAPVLVPFSFQQPWNLSAGATLNQLLFQPDVFVGLQARQTSLNYNQALIEQSKEKIKDSAYNRYYAILIAQKQLYFLNESLLRLAKLYHDDSLMFINGFAEKLDLDKVQVQLNNLKTTETVVQNAVGIGYAAMKFSLGISQKDTVVLKDDLSTETIKAGILDESFAYENRAEVRILNQLEKLQKLDIKRYKLGYLPTVSAIANYGVSGQGQKFFTNPNTIWFTSAYVGLSVNVPIFNGFQRKYKIQESEYTLQKVNNTLDFTKQAIDFEQVANKESLKNSLLNLDMQERNQLLAERVYNATKLKFEQGLGSSFEVLQADTEYQTAQSNYFNALYNATVARISYLYSLGKL
ncbi:MAG TPA: TolC family protein [Flavisolibacter sp.]|jgi:outer membrane protein TolC|nr:TolC family protein [Flavisolibacter sp.]